MKRFIRRVFAALAVAAVLVAVLFVILGWQAFGRKTEGDRRQRIERSKQWATDHFENPQPLMNDAVGSGLAFLDISLVSTPLTTDVPVVRGDAERFATPPPSGLRITWFGHSTTLVELDGKRFLTDPIFSERSSPYTFIGPRRWYPPPIPLAELPTVDAVLVSHDHYDHLDEATVRALKDSRFIVPLGIASHLEYWGVPAANITELDWWEDTAFGDVRVVSTPARHASGRHPFDQGATLWTSWALVGPQHRVWYSGDTGLFPAMNNIGERFGPFDVAMIEVGQYHRAWPDWHIGPEQAVQAVTMVRARTFFPIHWGLFTLAMHGWTEPIERAFAEATARQVPIVTPKPGQSVEPSAPPPYEKWWPDVAWETAKQHPIVSTQMGP